MKNKATSKQFFYEPETKKTYFFNTKKIFKNKNTTDEKGNTMTIFQNS